MRFAKSVLLTTAILFASITVSRASSAPSPASLWTQIKTLEAHRAILVGSHPFQLGSRTVDYYTVDLGNAPANDVIRKAGGITRVTRYPNGSVLVKKNYNEKRQLTGVTAMVKVDGYDKADRNWLMAAFSPTGKVVAYGKVTACIACHTMVTHQDFVFAPPPGQLLPASVWKSFFPTQTMSPAYLALLAKNPGAIVK